MGRQLDALLLGPARRARAMRRRLEALDRADARMRAAGLDPLDEWRRSREPRSTSTTLLATPRSRRRPVTFAAGILVFVLAVYLLSRHHSAGVDSAAMQSRSPARPSNVPPASREEHTRPLGRPAPAPAGRGGYRFEQTRPGSRAPVTWDPCRPIHYVVNGAAPDGQAGLVASVVSELSTLTGLRFVYDGPTGESAVVDDRSAYQPGRYGERWAPVLVAWTDPAQVPRLAGNVIGLGGPDAVTLGDAPPTYVTGTVYLDQPQFDRGPRPSRTAPPAGVLRAVVLHEFGHLLGLDHVQDAASIMYPEAQLKVSDYSDGDRRGLYALATGPCVPST